MKGCPKCQGQEAKKHETMSDYLTCTTHYCGASVPKEYYFSEQLVNDNAKLEDVCNNCGKFYKDKDSEFCRGCTMKLSPYLQDKPNSKERGKDGKAERIGGIRIN